MRRVAAGESVHSVAVVLKVSVSSVIAVLRPARWAGIGRFAYRESTGPGCLRALRRIRMSPCAASQGAWRTGDHGLSRDSRALPALRGPELQKKPTFPPNNCGQSSLATAPDGRPIKARLIKAVWSSSTRPGSKPTWRVAGVPAASGSSPMCRMAIGRQ
jgi:hypothetical protein